MRSAPQDSCGVFVACNIEGGGNGTDAVIECGNGNENEEKRRSQNRTRANGESGTGPGLPTGDGNDAGGVNTKAGTGAGRIPHTALPARRSFTGLPKVRARLPPRNPAERAAADSGMRPVKRQKGGFQQRTESRDIARDRFSAG